MRNRARCLGLGVVFGCLALGFSTPPVAADSGRSAVIEKARMETQELATQLTDLLSRQIREGRTAEAQETIEVLKQVLALKDRLDRMAGPRAPAPKAAPPRAGAGERPPAGAPPIAIPGPGAPVAAAPGIGGGAAGSFGGRGGHRNLRAEGGGAGTENAVNLGLDWLARHQDPKGFWDCDGFMANCTDGPCDGAGSALYDPGVSGLALLSFLGGGETPLHGKYKDTLKSGLAYLRSIQDPEGCFGPRFTKRFVYNHACAALAMTEAYALTGSPLFKTNAQLAIDFIHKCQNPYLAWRYGVRPKDNDTSVSGWMLMCLKSAKVAGLRVDQAGFDGMKAWLDKVTEPEYGRVGYTTRGSGPARPENLIDKFPTDKSEALTAIGILSRIYIGEDPRSSELIDREVDLCLTHLPVWDRQNGSIDMYYWYYGSLALFQVGGDAWRQWNGALKSAVVDHQRKSGCAAGSWDPVGPWGADGGRIYSTALMTMTMEVYYRYARVFGAQRK